METTDMIKVMQHYADGGEIEYSHNNLNSVFGDAIKKHDGDLAWDWNTYTYRISEPKQKVTIEKWLVKDVNSSEYSIVESSAIEKYKHYEKVKLIESYVYEVEL